MSKKTNSHEIREVIKLYYFGFKGDYLTPQKDFFKHTNIFLDSIDEKFNNMKVYSDDFFEYFNAGGYRRMFYEQFIVSLISMTEYKIKILMEELDYIFEENYSDDILEKNPDVKIALKKYTKKHLKIDLRVREEIDTDFENLRSLRNVIVHSGSRLWKLRKKNIHGVQSLSKKYPSIKIYDDLVWVNNDFCLESLEITKKYFYEICKNIIRNF